MDYRKTIKAVRDMKFAALRKVADDAGIHINTLLAIKAGNTTDPRLSTVEKIAKQLRRAA